MNKAQKLLQPLIDTMAKSGNNLAGSYNPGVLDGLRAAINALATLTDDITLAAQRRTIATLRARLQRRRVLRLHRGYNGEIFQTAVRNQYDALREGYSLAGEAGMTYLPADEGRHWLHEVRLAAIRNFGALP